MKKAKEYHLPLIIVFTFLLILSLALIISNLGKSQDIRQQASSQIGDPCTLLIYAKGDLAPMPITGTLQAGDDELVCEGGINDQYSSYYELREDAVADKQTPHYPCKNAGQYVGTTCRVHGKTGEKLCVGGPDYEYVGCLYKSSSEQYYAIIDGPNQVPADVTPTPTPPPAPTARPTSTSYQTPTPTTRPSPAPTGSSNWCVEGCIPTSADLNGDGRVDILDYTIMTSQFDL